jgi:hypothetical protein
MTLHFDALSALRSADIDVMVESRSYMWRPSFAAANIVTCFSAESRSHSTMLSPLFARFKSINAFVCDVTCKGEGYRFSGSVIEVEKY